MRIRKDDDDDDADGGMEGVWELWRSKEKDYKEKYTWVVENRKINEV